MTPGILKMNKVQRVRKPASMTPIRPWFTLLALRTRCTSVWLFAQK